MKVRWLSATYVMFFCGAAASGDDAARLTESLLERRGFEVGAVATVRFAGTRDGWRYSGIEVSAGQGVSLFGIGELDAVFGRPTRPHELLWLRVGDGEAFNLGGDAFSFVAAEDGEVALAIRPSGVNWLDCSGSFPPEIDSVPELKLDLSAVVVAWTSTLETGLSALAGNPLVMAALEDYRSRPTLPDGFQSLCYLRNSRAFHAWHEGDRRGVRGLARAEAGIIKKALDLPLDDESEITFDWRYATLPAQGPENDARYHDYSSLAVELDNGQDITWMWAGHVEAGTSFRCPLRWWDRRETHIVLRSGPEGLGEWETHTRRIAADYDRAVGGERPTRIVGVWFISVGIFGETTADATFANVTLRSGGRVVEVFEPGAEGSGE